MAAPETRPLSPTGTQASADWYRLAVEEAARRLGTIPASGLSNEEAQRRLEHYGANELKEQGGRSRWQILL
jgi:Ca2+-transporting ATPase